MRRAVVVLCALVVAGTALAIGSCGGGSGPYLVRAIFDDASFVVPGEDVKISGVRVGSIDSTSVTRDRKAAVVLAITEPAYQDFRADAFCKIRPQSLIGEQFVDCQPSQGRASTSGAAPELRRIEDGPGEGQRLLPVERTSVSVALDLFGNINRLPVRQRLSLILNELGVTLAGRGEDLNAVIRRSAPALQEVSKVVDLVATQNDQLKQLAVDSDTILDPLAQRRRNLTGFVREAQTVARATAERREALATSLQRFPTFLRETSPTMRRLGALADELTPVASDLRAQAPAINEVIARTAPFARAGTPALESLGDAAEPGIPAIRAALPITRDLRSFAQQLRPVARTLSAVLVSLRNNEGIERFLDFTYYQAQAVNGFDSVSHFLRAGLIVNTCSTYAVTPTPECAAKFSGRSGASAAARSLASTDPVLARTAAVLAGANPADVMRDPAFRDADEDRDASRGSRGSDRRGVDSGSAPGRGAGSGDSGSGSGGSGSTGGGGSSGGGSGGQPPAATPTAAPTSPPASTPSPAATTPPAPTPAPSATAQGGVLDFLFGKDG